MKKNLESWGTFDPRSEKFLKLHGRVIGRFWDPAKVCELTLRNAIDQTLKKLPIFPLCLALHKLSPIADMPTDPPTTAAELPAVQIWLGLANVR